MNNFFNANLFFFGIFSYGLIVCASFIYAATSNTEIDDITSWSCIEYLIPTYNTLVPLLHTFLAKNLDHLKNFNKILLVLNE